MRNCKHTEIIKLNLLILNKFSKLVQYDELHGNVTQSLRKEALKT